MTQPTHHEPTDPADMSDQEFVRWCDEQDARYANSYAERQLEAYLDYHESRDMQEMQDIRTAATAVTPARVLRDVALYLARHGWTQGSYYEQTATVFTPPACLVGAIGMVCYGGPVDAPALNHADPGWSDFADARDVLDKYLAGTYGEIEPGFWVDAYSFNDAKGRTVEQVLAAVGAAADQWERDHGQPAATAHADYPHDPGTLYDCPMCESACFYTDEPDCVHCAINAEDSWSNLGGAA